MLGLLFLLAEPAALLAVAALRLVIVGGDVPGGFGHGVGLDIHEQPNASPANEKPMPEGAVISAEPGIYLPGKFGVRIEDVLYLSGEGCVDITKAPKDLLIL